MKTLLITAAIAIASTQNVSAYDHDSSEAKLMQGIKDYKQSRNKFKRHGAAQESREQTVARLDQELQKSDYKKVKNEVAKYANHRADDSIIGYRVLGLNQGTKLMNVKTEKVHVLGKDHKKVLKLGIVKEFISKTDPRLIGNYWHIHIDGEEFRAVNSQAGDFEKTYSQVSKIRRERFGI